LLSLSLVPKGENSKEESKHIKKVQKEVQKLIDKHSELSPKQVSQMHKTVDYPLGDATVNDYVILDVIDLFIVASKNGDRKTTKGKRVSDGSLKNYEVGKKKIYRFIDNTSYNLQDWNNINDVFYNVKIQN
jgi:hypothetical protein